VLGVAPVEELEEGGALDAGGEDVRAAEGEGEGEGEGGGGNFWGGDGGAFEQPVYV